MKTVGHANERTRERERESVGHCLGQRTATVGYGRVAASNERIRRFLSIVSNSRGKQLTVDRRSSATTDGFVVASCVRFRVRVLHTSCYRLARVTIGNIQLIELAYKSISYDDLHKSFGLSRQMAEQIRDERQWQADADGIHLLPQRHGARRCETRPTRLCAVASRLDPLSATSNTNLAKLVELVCFLER
jgi:hypothetical protein